MFFFKKKPLVVDCFTHLPMAYDYTKPEVASKFMPDWFKKMPKTITTTDGFSRGATVKNCAGLIDLYSRGIMLSLWCDVSIEIGRIGIKDYRWQFSDHDHSAVIHHKDQIGSHFNDEKFAHLKLVSPWFLSTKEQVYWLWQEPTWNDLYNYDYKVIPAVVEFKYQHATNVNMMFRRKEQTNIHHMEYGTPLAHIIPIADNRKVVLKHHLVEQQEILKYTTPRLKFFDNYKNKIKQWSKR